MALSDNLIAYVPLTANDLPFTSNGHVFTASGATYRATAPGPAWEITGSDGNISATDVTDVVPLTLAVMVYVPGSAPSSLAFMGRVLGDSDYWDLEMVSGDVIFNARARSGGTAGDATSGGSLTGSAFNNFAGVYTSSTSRQAYVNGTLGAVQTTSVSPSGSGQILSIGALKRLSDVVQELPTGWYLKHAAAWNRALSQAELDAYFADPASVLVSAPVLTSPTATSPGTTTVTAGVTTDTPSGMLYQLARIGGSAASAATIITTGQSMAVSTTSPSRSYTGLTAGTTGYVIDMVQVVSAVNSNVVSTSAFDTAAGGTSPQIQHYRAQL